MKMIQHEGEKPEEKSAKTDEITGKFAKIQQPRQKSTKIGASTENSTQSALDENPIQSKWEFEKRTEIDQPYKKCTKFTQLPEKQTKSAQLQNFFYKIYSAS